MSLTRLISFIDYKQYYENLAMDQQLQESEETFDTVDENGLLKRGLDDAEDSARFVILAMLPCSLKLYL
jgi:hypothetical protein